MNQATLVTDAPLAYQYWGDIQRSERLVMLLHGVGGSRESWSDALSGTGSALAEAGLCAVAVDLPGYGFARVPHTERKRWQSMIEGYLTTREQLTGVLLLVDAHGHRELPRADKLTLARQLVAEIASRLNLPTA